MSMTNMRQLTLGGVGLCIGMAVAAAPGIAAADSLDFQISIDGYDLLPMTDNSATASSGVGDIAIAYGDAANANATSGFGDVAIAEGTGSLATTSLGGNVSDFDVAIANGEDSISRANDGIFNFASAFGETSNATAGGLFLAPSNFDLATTYGPGSTAFASGGNFDSALVVDTSTSYTGQSSSAYAEGGNDVATALGQDNFSFANGSNDISAIIGSGDGANAGAPGDFDLAAVIGNDLTAYYTTGGSDLYDIVTAFGNETGAAAATSGSSFLTDLLSLF
jgi:hypothetical protein